MDRIKQNPDGSFYWDSPIDTEYHQRAGGTGLMSVLIICAVVIFVFFFANRNSNAQYDSWIIFLVIGVILVIALPLLYLWNSASDPHEQYVMTDEYVRIGYGKSAVFLKYNKTAEITVTEKYIEMSGKFKTSRVYVPEQDLEFVLTFILERVPKDTAIRYNKNAA